MIGLVSFYPSPPAPLPQGERGAKRGASSQERKHLNRNGAKSVQDVYNADILSVFSIVF